MDPNVIMQRLIRLAKLDTTVFDEVRDDQRETIPAVAIVVIGALIAAIGFLLWLLIEKEEGLDIDFGNYFVNALLLGTIFTVAMWVVWVALVYVVLVQYFKEQTDLQSLLRTMGYASLPYVISVLIFIPGLSFGFALAAVVIWFVLSIYAVQATTAASSERVVIANIVGFLAFAIVLGLLARATGMASGVFYNTEAGRAVAEGEFYKIGDLSDFDID